MIWFYNFSILKKNGPSLRLQESRVFNHVLEQLLRKLWSVFQYQQITEESILKTKKNKKCTFLKLKTSKIEKKRKFFKLSNNKILRKSRSARKTKPGLSKLAKQFSSTDDIEKPKFEYNNVFNTNRTAENTKE